MATYDPRKVLVSWNGILITGFAKDSFVKVHPRSPSSVLEEAGADGECVRVLGGDDSYEIEIVLKRSSPSNTLLSQAHQSDRLGVPVSGPFSVKDPTTGRGFDAEDAFITEAPDWEAPGGGGYGDVTWKLATRKGFVTHTGRTA